MCCLCRSSRSIENVIILFMTHLLNIYLEYYVELVVMTVVSNKYLNFVGKICNWGKCARYLVVVVNIW
jgi:hypothetical protein